MLQNFLDSLKLLVWGTPTLIAIIAVSVVATVALRFIQFTEFFRAWGTLFHKEEGLTGELTPFQALLSTLNSSLGNGVIVGVAMAICMGGPGAVFWMFIIGFLCMILRFVEVYLSMSFASLPGAKVVLGGPFLYLSKIPGGFFWPYFYAFSCLIFVFVGGGAMQGNSVAVAFGNVIPLPLWVFGALLGGFVLYIVLGGAQRIMKISGVLVPLKVGLFLFFCLSTLIVFAGNIIPSLFLIVKSAFNPAALGGGFAGVTIQSMFRDSLTRMFGASEAGVGTAGILYGSTGSTRPFYNGLSAMTGTFMTVNMACCLLGLCIVASGAWQSGAVGAVLTAQTFATVFGVIGGFGTALLTILFGTGVFIAYGLIGRQCWIFLTGGRWVNVFNGLFCAAALVGSIIEIKTVWALVDVTCFFCVFANVLGILFLLPYVRGEVLPVLIESGK